MSVRIGSTPPPDRIGRLDALARRSEALARRRARCQPSLDAFVARMDDDLDTPGAWRSCSTPSPRANAAADAGDVGRAASLAAAVGAMCKAVGLELRAD